MFKIVANKTKSRGKLCNSAKGGTTNPTKEPNKPTTKQPNNEQPTNEAALARFSCSRPSFYFTMFFLQADFIFIFFVLYYCIVRVFFYLSWQLRLPCNGQGFECCCLCCCCCFSNMHFTCWQKETAAYASCSCLSRPPAAELRSLYRWAPRAVRLRLGCSRLSLEGGL